VAGGGAGAGVQDPAAPGPATVTAPDDVPPPETAVPIAVAESISSTQDRTSRFRWPALKPGGRRRRRFSKPLAVLLAVVIVLCLVGAGGYLASRQLYFIGTNAQGIVTIYRGFPYDLPAGIHLYETFYVSGVPASLVPSDRRAALFNNSLRSESSAANTVRQLELGRISK
jgi:protein phosphatase